VTITPEKIQIPEALLGDSYLMVESRIRNQAEYPGLVSCVSSPLSQAKLGITEGTDYYLKRLRRYWRVQWSLPLCFIAVIGLAWRFSWWWLLALLLCLFAWGRVNYNQIEANKVLGAYLIAFDRLLEEEPWRSSKEGVQAQALIAEASRMSQG
jgi:hypothetical protein